ncbi:hypothetical protein [Rickettsiella endosymbiont of Dermanyssus gallinae]|uniref:hypothetical protein n=1 Tax=Rickettsiella endosymbiont of Dermanyssus gallinae TaxID=2856608 RepID=UPI001C52AF93|nr:hypothetical protein [Rickettsiella endosymbiont of Dermanyssus gallinae]
MVGTSTDKDYFSALQENIRQKLWLRLVIGSLLIESRVTSVDNFPEIKQAFCYLPRPMESSSEEETASCSSNSEQVSRYAPEEFRPWCPRNSFA